jgi:hypothetical protein
VRETVVSRGSDLSALRRFELRPKFEIGSDASRSASANRWSAADLGVRATLLFCHIVLKMYGIFRQLIKKPE